MKTLHGIVATIAMSLAMSAQAQADMSKLSISVKVGTTVVDEADFEELGIDATGNAAFGINLGYEFTPGWSAELQVVSAGVELEAPSAGTADIDVRSAGVYAAYRSSGPAYFIGRVGFINVTTSADFLSEDESDSGSSLGLGAGYRLNPNLGLELEYTIATDETDWVLVSTRYSFN